MTANFSNANDKLDAPVLLLTEVMSHQMPAISRGVTCVHERIKITQNWQATAAVRYDLDAHKLSGTSFGVGYIDDCLILALNYMRNYTYSGVATRDDRIMLQLTLRTLGGTSVSQTVSSAPAGL